MNFFYILILAILYSCGYPDIDSVPVFDDLNITKEESIDLCKLSNTNEDDLLKCLNDLEEKELNE